MFRNANARALFPKVSSQCCRAIASEPLHCIIVQLMISHVYVCVNNKVVYVLLLPVYVHWSCMYYCYPYMFIGRVCITATRVCSLVVYVLLLPVYVH